MGEVEWLRGWKTKMELNKKKELGTLRGNMGKKTMELKKKEFLLRTGTEGTLRGPGGPQGGRSCASARAALAKKFGLFKP